MPNSTADRDVESDLLEARERSKIRVSEDEVLVTHGLLTLSGQAGRSSPVMLEGLPCPRSSERRGRRPGALASDV
jgi:hypothetical protein